MKTDKAKKYEIALYVCIFFGILGSVYLLFKAIIYNFYGSGFFISGYIIIHRQIIDALLDRFPITANLAFENPYIWYSVTYLLYKKIKSIKIPDEKTMADYKKTRTLIFYAFLLGVLLALTNN